MNAVSETERMCPKCGAVYPKTEPKCPYCGYIHEEGAERKFFHGLERTRRTLDGVDDAARQDYRAEIRKNSRAVVKRVLIAAAILAAVIGLFAFAENRMFRDDRDYVQEMVWQHEHFPELDRLYEEKNYEELDALLNKYSAESHDIWDWDHFDEYTEKRKE